MTDAEKLAARTAMIRSVLAMEFGLDTAEIDRWLDAPNSGFQWRTPRWVLANNPEAVERMVYLLVSGTPS